MKALKIFLFTFSLLTLFSFTKPVSVNTDYAMTLKRKCYTNGGGATVFASWPFSASFLAVYDVTSGASIIYYGAYSGSAYSFPTITGHTYYIDAYNISTDDSATGMITIGDCPASSGGGPR